MVIVGGVFEVEPAQREDFLADHHDVMRNSRSETGCLEYVYSADPLDPSRVMLFERWESRSCLNAHLDALRLGPKTTTSVEAKTTSITIYEVTGAKELKD